MKGTLMAANPFGCPLMACRAEHSVTNIPANRVQGTYPNRCMSNALTAAELNARYLAGQIIELAPLAAMETDSCHFEARLRIAAETSPPNDEAIAGIG